MAGAFPNEEFKMLNQLKTDGWYLTNMEEYDDKLSEVVKWCQEILGPMLVIYDIDRFLGHCWHGGVIELPGKKEAWPKKNTMTIFAFEHESDYTMLKLKFA